MNRKNNRSSVDLAEPSFAAEMADLHIGLSRVNLERLAAAAGRRRAASIIDGDRMRRTAVFKII